MFDQTGRAGRFGQESGRDVSLQEFAQTPPSRLTFCYRRQRISRSSRSKGVKGGQGHRPPREGRRLYRHTVRGLHRVGQVVERHSVSRIIVSVLVRRLPRRRVWLAGTGSYAGGSFAVAGVLVACEKDSVSSDRHSPQSHSEDSTTSVDVSKDNVGDA